MKVDLKKAKYIQYPLTYGIYNDYGIDGINRLPLPENGMMYDAWENNTNHFTTEYHRLYSIPLLCRLFDLEYKEDDFVLDKRDCNGFDISILKPKAEYRYEIFGYTRNEHLNDLSFDEITTNTSTNSDITDYHRLYRYSHECSRLINKTIDNNRILFIGGDSQMIPDISFLSCFFKEIWYFDNRKKLYFTNKFTIPNFTDILIEMNHLPLSEYINTNIELGDSNVDIFIGTQKTFTPAVTNEAYKIIVGNHEIENNSNLELIKCKHDSALDDRFYSELYMLDYVSKKFELKKYVGFCHNRRYWNFLDDIPNLDEIFNDYDCIVAKPIIFEQPVKYQYGILHNIEDLYIIGGIIADKYPDYANMWHNFINGNIFIPYNMFIMKQEDFQEYIKFVFDVLDEYLRIVGVSISKRIYDNYEKYIKNFYPNDTVGYQYRIGGYIGERLTNLFLMTRFKKMKTYPVIVTEDKYNENKKG